MLRSYGLVIILALGLQGGVAQQAPGPGEVVTRFLALDASGARLRSTATDPIWKLTIDNGEPPELPIVLVDSCRVTGMVQRQKSAKVQVLCSGTATVADDGRLLSYHRERRVSKTTFTVLRTGDGWKISLKDLMFSPHVAKAAYVSHLNALIRLYRTEKDKADPRYKSLLAVREALRAEGAR